jgi:hypothetical protein
MNEQVVPAVDDVSRHRGAHDAQADESNFTHDDLPFFDVVPPMT